MKFPKHWLQISIDQLIITQKGKKPARLSDKPFKNSIFYLDIEALERDNITQFADPYSTILANENDILMVWDGSRSGLVFKAKNGAVGSTIMCLTPIGVNSDFLCYFLRSKYNDLNTNLVGGSIPHVNSEQFYEIKVPYPTLIEQEDIVSRLKNGLTKFEYEIKSSTEIFHNNLRNYLIEINPELKNNTTVKIYSLNDFIDSLLESAFNGQLFQTKKIRQLNLKG